MIQDPEMAGALALWRAIDTKPLFDAFMDDICEGDRRNSAKASFSEWFSEKTNDMRACSNLKNFDSTKPHTGITFREDGNP